MPPSLEEKHALRKPPGNVSLKTQRAENQWRRTSAPESSISAKCAVVEPILNRGAETLSGVGCRRVCRDLPAHPGRGSPARRRRRLRCCRRRCPGEGKVLGITLRNVPRGDADGRHSELGRTLFLQESIVVSRQVCETVLGLDE